MRLLALFLLTSLAGPAAAAPEWRQAREYDVRLSSFDIAPETIRLKADQPVRLRLVNQSGQRHGIAAGPFFRTSEPRSREAEELRDGKLIVEPGDTREILIVPKRGRYSIRSSNFLYRIMGMSAKVVVE